MSEPTHFSPNGHSSIIDLVFLSNPHQLIHCHILPPLANSDHVCIDVLLSAKRNNYALQNQPKISRKVWLYDRADFELANIMLDGCEDLLNLDNDIETAWCK